MSSTMSGIGGKKIIIKYNAEKNLGITFFKFISTEQIYYKKKPSQ